MHVEWKSSPRASGWSRDGGSHFTRVGVGTLGPIAKVGLGRGPCGCNRKKLRWETEVHTDFLHGQRVFDQGNKLQPLAAVGAGENVLAKHSFEELSP